MSDNATIADDNKNGRKVTAHAHLMPFGTGKRTCVGEGIAKQVLFLVAANLLQTFRFARPYTNEINGITANKKDKAYSIFDVILYPR